MRLDVFVNLEPAGVLEQLGTADFVFTYHSEARHPVSLTMPVRTASYHSPFLHPVFQVSLPEGRLRLEIEKTLSKRMASFGDMEVLAVVGSSMIGRIQALPAGMTPDPPKTAQTTRALESLMVHGASRSMLSEFVDQHASSSGVSGGYLKVLARLISDTHSRDAAVIGDWIVKLADDDHPHLPLNEYLSMQCIEACGIPVPKMRLSDDAQILLVKRFDRTPDGEQQGFEDMCSLMGLPSNLKFSGSAENVVKTISQFTSGKNRVESLHQFFTQYACAAMLRNGDAHLKNFGVVYSDLNDARLSPCYDMVTMAAYAHFLPNGSVDDMMALTLSGTKRWPTRKDLAQLAVRCGLKPDVFENTLRSVFDAVKLTSRKVEIAMAEHKDFAEIGKKMLLLWGQGVDLHRNPTHFKG